MLNRITATDKDHYRRFPIPIDKGYMSVCTYLYDTDKEPLHDMHARPQGAPTNKGPLQACKSTYIIYRQRATYRHARRP